MTCKTHPDAPHGFVRGASHSEDRYVCECEFWEEPKMNERIRLLAEQAGIYNLELTDETEYWILEKFAELIVKECIDSVENTNDRHRKDYFANKIRQHFGVEE
jgi:hypothetical protein